MTNGQWGSHFYSFQFSHLIAHQIHAPPIPLPQIPARSPDRLQYWNQNPLSDLAPT